MRKRFLAGVASMLMVTAMFAGCSSDVEETVPPEAEQIQVTEAVETTAATEAVQPTVPENCVVIGTSYGNLQYQDQWAEFMQVSQMMDGENLDVTFSAQVNDIQYPLFELTIGTLDGQPAGQLTDAGGVQRNVYIRMMEIAESSALTDSEMNRIYAMQEDINYVIENLK